MNCNKCGYKLNENSNICPNCGNVSSSNIIENPQLVEVSNQQVSPQLVNNVDNNANSKSKKVLIIIIAIMLIVLLMILLPFAMRINKKSATIKVPYANQTINPGTNITEDMISYLEIPKSFLINSYYGSSSQIVAKCSNYNTIIPKGSIFYLEMIDDCVSVNDNMIDNSVDDFHSSVLSFDAYNSGSRTIELNSIMNKLEKSYNQLIKTYSNINNINISNDKKQNLINYINEAKNVYNDIKKKTYATDKNKYESDLLLLSEYYNKF